MGTSMGRGSIMRREGCSNISLRSSVPVHSPTSVLPCPPPVYASVYHCSTSASASTSTLSARIGSYDITTLIHMQLVEKYSTHLSLARRLFPLSRPSSNCLSTLQHARAHAAQGTCAALTRIIESYSSVLPFSSTRFPLLNQLD